MRGRAAFAAVSLAVVTTATFAAGAPGAETAIGGAGTTAGVPARAQQRPDFSGAWDAQPAGGGRGGRGARPVDTMGSGWGPSITISQDAATLTVERVFFSSGDLQPPIKLRYALDGSESVNEVLMGRGFQRHASTTRWEGEALVISTAYVVADPESSEEMTSEVRRTLVLRPSQSLVRTPSLVVETYRSGVMGGPAETTRTVYNRR